MPWGQSCTSRRSSRWSTASAGRATTRRSRSGSRASSRTPRRRSSSPAPIPSPRSSRTTCCSTPSSRSTASTPRTGRCDPPRRRRPLCWRARPRRAPRAFAWTKMPAKAPAMISRCAIARPVCPDRRNLSRCARCRRRARPFLSTMRQSRPQTWAPALCKTTESRAFAIGAPNGCGPLAGSSCSRSPRPQVGMRDLAGASSGDPLRSRGMCPTGWQSASSRPSAFGAPRTGSGRVFETHPSMGRALAPPRGAMRQGPERIGPHGHL